MVDQRMYPTFYRIFVISTIITITSVILNLYFEYQQNQNFEVVKTWLSANKLEIYVDLFEYNDLTSLQKIAQLPRENIRYIIMQSSANEMRRKAQEGKFEELATHVKSLNGKLRFQYWLIYNLLDNFENIFTEYNIYTLEDVAQNLDILRSDQRLTLAYFAFNSIERDKKILDKYPVENTVMQTYYSIWIWVVRMCKVFLLLGIFIIVMPLLFIGIIITRILNQLWPQTFSWSRYFSGIITNFYRSNRGSSFTNLNSRNTRDNNKNNNGWITRLFGNYFDAQKTTLSWNVSVEDSIVGDEAIIHVKFFMNNGTTYNVSSLKSMKVEIFLAQVMIECNIVYEKQENMISVHFTPIKSGYYEVSIFANGELVVNSSHNRRYFKPGNIDPFKSNLVVPSSLLVLQKDVEELLTFDEKDKYGNQCILNFENLFKYQFIISEIKSGTRITPEIRFLDSDEYADQRNRAYISITEPGLYKADILYDNEMLSDNVIFLVLTSDEMAEVNKNIAGTNWNVWYEARIANNCEQSRSNLNLSQTVSTTNVDSKKKKVYCYISPKFIIIKEYWLKIIPRKLFAFRINPAVKITMLNDTNATGWQNFAIESLSGQVVLFCQKRNVLVATFVKLLLKHIGGSECFEDKRKYFYDEIKKLHSLKSSMRTIIKVRRENVVDDTWHTVKLFSQGDWWKKFEIVFEGEPGMDYGGLSREWIHLLINELFHNNMLFRRFDVDNLQALIHPNHYRIGKYKKLKYYELAGLIVAKCVIECSFGKDRQQYVKARFTRSFLSLILGFGISWKHFETDDKEYFTGKIKYIIENDPDCLDIYFTEDVYNNENQLVKTLELKTSGSRIKVDESNKMDYIQRLAEYRLLESVKDEVTAFLKGLQFLIPDGLLSIFDENELELLLCGMGTISLSDLKTNHIQNYGADFTEVINWFWTTISGFSQEELARLLQFTTGCSQLPPDGFAGLNPKFKITSFGGTDTLPTAHTCFNQLCLPYYSSMKELKSKLLLAITEGSEGFGFA